MLGCWCQTSFKCKVVLLSVSAVHAAFHFQTCTKSPTTNLAKKTLALLYCYTMWHNTEDKAPRHPHRQSITLQKLAPRNGNMSKPACVPTVQRGLWMPETPREPSGWADCTAELGGDWAAQAPGNCLSSQTSKEHRHSASQGGYTVSEKCTDGIPALA